MIKKFFTFGAMATLTIGLMACSDTETGNAANSSGVEEAAVGSEEPVEEPAAPSPEKQESTDEEENTTAGELSETDRDDEEEEISDEQKQMAIDTLNGIVEDAEKGVVYRFSSGFIVGESTRDEVYAEISEPEEQVGEFDYYHGSMGQASYQIKYDENDVMEEARYFGTNVERQTNLGGIARADLIEQIGEPAEEREIPDTGETNIIYYMGNYELQFIIGEEGSTDHVNLLEKA